MSPIPFIQPILAATFHYPIKLCATTTLTTYVLSLITGNVSQVDRVWTFLPTIYTAYWALFPLWPRQNTVATWLFPYVPVEVPNNLVKSFSPRAVLMFGLVFTWMCRLSYNTWRRGLFNLQDEDYRWAVLRTKIPSWLFQFFNLTFIAITQNLLLLLLGLPTHRALTNPTPLTPTDYALSLVALTLIALEFTADNQQFAYHTFKQASEPGAYDARAQWPGARLGWTEADKKRGFVTRGLWAWSRHPNFWCEQSFWGVITLFPLLSSPTAPLAPASLASFSSALHALAPLAPALALCVLFVSSTGFTEAISLSKYPEAYGAYRKRVAMFVPWVTPVWGALLRAVSAPEEVERVERLVWGQVDEKEKVE